MRKVPAWVTTLATDVCDKACYDIPDASTSRLAPEIHWRVSKWRGGTGHCYGDHIAVTVTVGSKRSSQKAVLLHELAHWLCPYDWHGDRWGRVCYALYKRYNVPLSEGMSYSSFKRAKKRVRLIKADSERRLGYLLVAGAV